ncbi:MAG: maleylacetoacetate isomerase [Hyphomicrobium sp.]
MSEHPRFDLYSYWRTAATYRVRVALNLKGLAAEEHNVNLDTGEQRSPEFLKINPLGAVPALFDREAGAGRPALTQSLAILEYIEEVQPSPALLPRDAYGRARVRAIAAMLAADTHPLITGRIKRYLTTEGGFDDAKFRAWQIHWFTTGLQAVEQRLASDAETGTYCHGDAVSIADICLASIIAVLPIFKIEVGGIPTINRIMATCMADPAFIKAEPLRQAGAPKA